MRISEGLKVRGRAPVDRRIASYSPETQDQIRRLARGEGLTLEEARKRVLGGRGT